jgi:NAD(P)H dehydrogenase (quinone)
MDGYDVTFSDLYRMGFDPREAPEHYDVRKDDEVFHAQTEQRFNAESGSTPQTVRDEVERIKASDLLVVHFPLWWFGMPAILKGWMDRTFVYGDMYTGSRRYDAGVCVGKDVIACVTTGASAESCSYNGREGETLMLLWPALFAFRYIGFRVLVPELLHGVGGVSFVEDNDEGLSTLSSHVERWQRTLSTLSTREGLVFNRDTDFDESKRLVANAPTYSPFVRHDPDAGVITQ